MRDHYATDGERAALERWRAGDRDPRAAAADDLDDWMDLVRTLTGRGVAVRRVRVVSVPASEYIRFEASVVPMQQAAGEEFRYLPRTDPVAADLPTRDFWLFDQRRALVLNFDDDGRPLEHELHDDPAAASWYTAIRDTAWPAATPYDQYAPNLQ